MFGDGIGSLGPWIFPPPTYISVRIAPQIARVLSNIIQLSNAKKNCALISTLLEMKTTQCAAQKLIK